VKLRGTLTGLLRKAVIKTSVSDLDHDVSTTPSWLGTEVTSPILVDSGHFSLDVLIEIAIMVEVMEDENPLGLASWVPTEALNALNVTREGGVRTLLVKPEHLLFAMFLLALGTAAFLMHYSVSLKVPSP
jgi:hypothetical protein